MYLNHILLCYPLSHPSSSLVNPFLLSIQSLSHWIKLICVIYLCLAFDYCCLHKHSRGYY